MPEPFAPRLRARLHCADFGSVVAKVHWIDAEGASTPPAVLLGAALATARDVLPAAMAAEGGDEGAAFVVLHRGRDGTWLLMGWWAHGDVLCQRLARADPGGADFRPMDGRPLVACVWEMEVLADEARAWARHMMRASPDRDGWRRA